MSREMTVQSHGGKRGQQGHRLSVGWWCTAPGTAEGASGGRSPAHALLIGPRAWDGGRASWRGRPLTAPVSHAVRERAEPVAVGAAEGQHQQPWPAGLLPPWHLPRGQVELLPPEGQVRWERRPGPPALHLPTQGSRLQALAWGDLQGGRELRLRELAGGRPAPAAALGQEGSVPV